MYVYGGENNRKGVSGLDIYGEKKAKFAGTDFLCVKYEGEGKKAVEITVRELSLPGYHCI